MIDYARFWSDGPPGYFEADEDDAPPDEAAPGVTREAILAWEREHGVTLPEPLRTALAIQDGGYLRNAPILVNSLDEIVPVEEDFWDYTEIDEDEAPDHALMFAFGDEAMSGATLLMNFNAAGPEGPPSVYMDHHGESTYRVGETILGFFEAQLAADDAPMVSWEEAEASESVLASEAVDLSAMHQGRPATSEQVLVDHGDSLVLFTRERWPRGQSLSRTILPLPLDATLAEVRPYRPAPIGTSALHLQPAESDGIIHIQSETDADGRWKTTTGHGVPVYVMFESADPDRLRALRERLLGAAPAARAQARQDDQAAMQSMLDMLPPEQRTAALLQAAQHMRREMAARFGDPGPAPPEVAGAVEAMQRRLEEMAERVRQQAAANPPDPETVRRITDHLRDQAGK